MNRTLLMASLAIFIKDIHSELRTRYALNALLLFAATTAVAVSVGVGPIGIRHEAEWVMVQATLLWVALLFAALSGLSHSFVREEETRTALALRMAAPPLAVYLGKLCFNVVLLGLLDVVTSLLFLLFVRVEIGNMWLFVTMLAAGSVCIATATTILAAIISRASLKGALFSVLSFPLLVPPLLAAIDGTAAAINGTTWAQGSAPLHMLVGYAIATFVASLLLFRFVWEA